MSRRRAATLLATCAAALTLHMPADAAVPTGAPSAKQLVLRLPDLPGYVVDRTGPDDTCSVFLFDTDVPRDVWRLWRRIWVDSCNVFAHRVWTTPGAPPSPPDVVTSAFLTTGADGAAALLALPSGFLSSVIPVPRSAWVLEPTTAAIGEETQVLHTRTALFEQGPGVAVLWRSGPVAAFVAVDGRNRATAEQTALRLAAVQQERIAAPTPLAPSDFDDLEVPLGDPRIDVPVVWLGRTYDGGPRLPRVRLEMGDPLTTADRRRGVQAVLPYGPRHDVISFELMLFSPGAFELRALRRELMGIRRGRCVRRERMPLLAGSATLYVARRGCRSRSLDAPVALVRLPGIRVAVVPEVGCESCGEVPTRYASLAGVRAIVRALRLRS